MKNDISSRLIELRLSNRYSQKYVAISIGVTQPVISSWETNITSPSKDNLLKLAELYGVSVDYILGNSNEDNTDSGKNTLSADEMRLIDDYRSLNAQGKESVRQFVYMALAVYKKSSDLPGVERATS